MKAAQNLRAKIGAGALALGTAVMASPAMAAIDVTDVVTEIEGVKAPIGLIGVAVLGVVVAILAFSYVRRAMK